MIKRWMAVAHSKHANYPIILLRYTRLVMAAMVTWHLHSMLLHDGIYIVSISEHNCYLCWCHHDACIATNILIHYLHLQYRFHAFTTCTPTHTHTYHMHTMMHVKHNHNSKNLYNQCLLLFTITMINTATYANTWHTAAVLTFIHCCITILLSLTTLLLVIHT